MYDCREGELSGENDWQTLLHDLPLQENSYSAVAEHNLYSQRTYTFALRVTEGCDVTEAGDDGIWTANKQGDKKLSQS